MNHVSTCLLVCHHFSHHRITITSGITTYCSLATLVLLLLLGFLFVRLFSFSLLFAGHLLPCSVDLMGSLTPKKNHLRTQPSYCTCGPFYPVLVPRQKGAVPILADQKLAMAVPLSEHGPEHPQSAGRPGVLPLFVLA